MKQTKSKTCKQQKQICLYNRQQTKLESDAVDCLSCKFKLRQRRQYKKIITNSTISLVNESAWVVPFCLRCLIKWQNQPGSHTGTKSKIHLSEQRRFRSSLWRGCSQLSEGLRMPKGYLSSLWVLVQPETRWFIELHLTGYRTGCDTQAKGMNKNKRICVIRLHFFTPLCPMLSNVSWSNAWFPQEILSTLVINRIFYNSAQNDN